MLFNRAQLCRWRKIGYHDGMETAYPDFSECRLCPRLCGVDRTRGGEISAGVIEKAVHAPRSGVCGQSDRMVLACATRHFGEEPPLSSRGGSGALFFSGCTLRCSFCQNRQLSRGEVGREISVDELVRICLVLQEQGAENINFVSATPFIPSVEAAVLTARREGLQVPVVWNSSGYEMPEQVERLAGFVDIFLPDLKLLDPELSGRLFGARDYPEQACAAVEKMAELRPVRWNAGPYGDKEGGEGEYEAEGPDRRLVSGTIVRHLVLPGLLGESRRVMEWFGSHLKERALFSLMVQFSVPEGISGWRRGVMDLENRILTGTEYRQLLDWLEEYGIDEGFIQEPGAEESWWPDFRRYNPFPEEFSQVVWSWSSSEDRSPNL